MTREKLKLSKRAKSLLKRIGDTGDASMRLTKANAKPSDELREMGLAMYIPVSIGGADVVLTQAGVDAYDEAWPE